jgi:steroid 5-alpha reductase family enzyme
MKKLNIPLMATLLGLSIIVCPILYFTVGPMLDASQMEALRILLVIAGCSAAFCFIVGEATGNNSQMDKLWSLLPIAYTWVIAAKGGMSPRLVVMAVLATLWGIRLTFNFARKGAYRLKFWEGEEDYRWEVVRSGPTFKNKRWAWALFDLGFISIYQNALVLMTTFPALVAMRSDAPFGWVDCVAAVLMLGFIIWETVADEQQWAFQTRKHAMLAEGRKLADLPAPYNKGFNTNGLWSRSRHPNYFAEQSIWICFYIFSIGAGIGILNWSVIGALLLVVLFQGSSSLAEEISSGKYPEYERYCQSVNRFIPGKKYSE